MFLLYTFEIAKTKCVNRTLALSSEMQLIYKHNK